MAELSKKITVSTDAINERLDQLAATLNTEYAGKPLVMICVLKGALMFFADLVRRLDNDPELEFVRVASYGSGTSSSRNVSFTKDIEISIKDKHVVLVDDIVDSGHTMSFLLQQFAARQAKSIKIAALIDKTERREISVKVDFPGFVISKGYLIGYGLDYDERYRTLPAIYTADFF